MINPAKLLNVSTASVDRAKQVVERGAKELIQAVERGEVSLNQAVNLVKAVPSKPEQTKLVREGKQAIKEAIKPADPNAKSKTKALPKSEPSSDEPDDYDYPIVKAFEQCDYRLNTLKRICEMLAPHERQVVLDFLQGPVGGKP